MSDLSKQLEKAGQGRPKFLINLDLVLGWKRICKL